MLFNMTPDEFFEKLKECLADAMFATEPNEGVKVEKHYVYGLQGLCDLLGCSTATASRINARRKGLQVAVVRYKILQLFNHLRELQYKAD